MAFSTISQAEGKRIYAIGDIHGCAEEPEHLLRHLDKEEGIAAEDVIVFLGDYIDRGPTSRQVIELMLDVKARFPKTRFLKGNHEDMLLDFLGFGGKLGSAFLYNGGLETIQSYGLSVFAPPMEIIQALPPAHFKFFCELESLISVGDFLLVHAGLNPARQLASQLDSEIYWIREEFLMSKHTFQKTVVFGHSPHQEMFVHLPYKIGIDTGLVFGNKLSCIELSSGRAFEIARGSNQVIESQINMSKKERAVV